MPFCPARAYPVGEEGAFLEGEDVFHGIELRAVGRQPQPGNVGGDLRALRAMPSGSVEHEHGMASGRDRGRDVGEMAVHLIGIGAVANMAHRHRVRRAGGGEQDGVAVPVIPDHARATSLARPDPRQHALLPGPRFILKPDFDALRIGSLGRRIQRQPTEIKAKSRLLGGHRQRVNGTRRNMRKAERAQQAADRFQAETNVEMRQHLVADVRQAPAAYAVGFEVLGVVDPRRHRRPLRRRHQRAANLAARPAIQNQRNRPQATRLRGALALTGQVVWGL